jgi:hypothetical protein
MDMTLELELVQVPDLDRSTGCARLYAAAAVAVVLVDGVLDEGLHRGG